MGGRLSISVAGSSDVTITQTQANNLNHTLTGILTGNISYVVPSKGRFFFIKNSTTGAFSVTVKPVGGTGVVVPQGDMLFIFVNPDTASAAEVISKSSYSGGSFNPTGTAIPSPQGIYAPGTNTLGVGINGTNVANFGTAGFSATAINNTPIGNVTPSTAAFTTPAQGNSSTSAATTAFLSQNDPSGWQNRLRNCLMNVARRGNTGTSSTTGVYTIDGWMVDAAGAAVTWNQTGASANASGYTTPGSLQIVGNTSVSSTKLRQRIEGSVAAMLSGKQTTFQINIVNNTGATITPTITVKHANAIDDWSGSTTDVNAVSLQPVANGVNATLAYTFACSGSAYQGLEITVDLGSVLNSAAKNVYFASPNLRSTHGVATGLNAAPPPPEYRSYEAELAFCKRYLPGFFSSSITTPIGIGKAVDANNFILIMPYDVESRIPATGITVSGAGHITIANPNSTVSTASNAINFNAASINCLRINCTNAGNNGNASGNATEAFFNNATAYILCTGAEL